jgi:hypothetical protein
LIRHPGYHQLEEPETYRVSFTNENIYMEINRNGAWPTGEWRETMDVSISECTEKTNI